MLPLKPYQQRTLEELKNFLINASILKGSRGIRLAYLDQIGDEERQYKPITGLEEAPYVCVKIPTAGGKTLVASHALQVVSENYLQYKSGKGLVLWFVPSEAIRSQTYKNLNDRNHSYREVIDTAFGNNVKVFSLEQALSIQKSDIENNLCIVVSSLQAFRRTDRLWLKVFKNNGALLPHFENLTEDNGFLDKEEGEIIYSLANVVKINSPIVILDEGHNAQTLLSFEMLQRLNPSFMLEFTATPRSESNVLVKVLATELKAAKMVKIPIWLSNVSQWQEAVRDGVSERNKLEKLAVKERLLSKDREYIRPICLLQAEQEKVSGSKIYVDQIKTFLLEELKIPEEQIVIKTATRNQIDGIDLLSRKCPIRYIITVNALKEGWDCPFAYVLVSVANIGSKIAVEQTIGRILRLPNAKDKGILELNNSYVYTSSESFSKAGSAVIKGLEQNGYSRADLKENKGKITAEKISFDRFVEDKDIKIPYIGLKTKKEPLAFNRDLIGLNFKVFEHYNPIKIDFYSDQNQRVKIDIDKENKIFRITQGKLTLVLYPEDFSLEEIGNWLKRNVRNVAISSEEMGKYIDLVLKDLSKAHKLEELSLNRFKLKEDVQASVQSIVEAYAKRNFENLLKEGKLDAVTACYEPERESLLSRLSPEHFQKHLFERAGYMNAEEMDFAMRLDVQENIKWWYRNREKVDFYLQGWKPFKFYPDFICKTKKGKYVLAEYKGEQLATSEDTRYKKELGSLWEKLSKESCNFYLAEKNTSDAVLKEIQKL